MDLDSQSTLDTILATSGYYIITIKWKMVQAIVRS
jgi:hypothetical protein